jgi:hypothetical protein
MTAKKEKTSQSQPTSPPKVEVQDLLAPAKALTEKAARSAQARVDDAQAQKVKGGSCRPMESLSLDF